MNWEIKKKKIIIQGDKAVSVAVDFPFDCFLDTYNLVYWNKLISAIIIEENVDYQGVVEIIFSHNLDWHDVNISNITMPNNTVMATFKLELPSPHAIMGITEFKKMFLDFSKELYNIHRNDDYLPLNWRTEMENNLLKLEQNSLR